MDKQRTINAKLVVAACALIGAGSIWATPPTDDCVAGSGCIRTADGSSGEFELFANFDFDSYSSTGFIRYSDANYTISSDEIYDYADPEGPGGYRILSFHVSNPSYPSVTEIRVVVEDFGASIDDYFEIQIIGGGNPYVAAGNLLSDCGGGIAISQDCAPSGENPPPAPAECDDFVTGGGWIVGPNGAKANFGLHGGIKHGAFWGGLNFLDHATRMHVKSTAVTAYTQVDEIGREIRFNVNIDGEPGTAILRVWDNGEPGRNDLFQIALSTGYVAAGDLGGDRPGGGNLQLHKAKCGEKGKPAKPDKNKPAKGKGSRKK